LPAPVLAPDVRALLDPDPDPTRRGRPAPPSAVAAGAAAAFATLSRLRGRRSLHPSGIVLAGTLRVPAGGRVPLPAAWQDLDGGPAIVRASRSLGLPESLPDVLGLAVRAGGQDLLVTTSRRGPGVQHLFLPARCFLGPTFSSVLPFQVAGRTLLVTATLRAPGPHRGAPTLGELARLAGGGLTLDLRLTSFVGRTAPLGTIALEVVLADADARAVRFDPWRAGAGLVPTGVGQDLRRPAYAASRRGTPAGSR